MITKKVFVSLFDFFCGKVFLGENVLFQTGKIRIRKVFFVSASKDSLFRYLIYTMVRFELEIDFSLLCHFIHDLDQILDLKKYLYLYK